MSSETKPVTRCDEPFGRVPLIPPKGIPFSDEKDGVVNTRKKMAVDNGITYNPLGIDDENCGILHPWSTKRR